MLDLENAKIGIIGLGYVGLPLAVEFSQKYPVIGFDINTFRISSLKEGIDNTSEIDSKELLKHKNLHFTSDTSDLKKCNVYIVTVPTPITINKQPDLKPLVDASTMIGSIIGKGDTLIYESTVYPGATEDDCVPIVESISGLKLNHDFFVGYSPERINPGDRDKKVSQILKVTSGSNEESADFIDRLYKSIIVAGTHKAASIKIAEGAKIVENVQRDVNIALINELHQIFTKMEIDTNSVIEAASTKWNFMKLTPGLVGGHCISVDPYYLLHKSEKKGFIPDLMRTGREINDSMPDFLVKNFLTELLNNKINPVDLEVALVGFTFKEDCPDIRNTKSYDVYNGLVRLGFKVRVYDYVADKQEVADLYNLNIENNLEIKEKVIFLAVGHEKYKNLIQPKDFDYVYDFKGSLKL